MNVLLISTYELGRQPFGLASPAAWLRRAGCEVTCVDLTRDRLPLEDTTRADLVAFHLPMHTATRLAVPVIARVQSLNPSARLCAYGVYAPLNAAFLRGLGVEHVFGGEFEADLTELADDVRRGRRDVGRVRRFEAQLGADRSAADRPEADHSAADSDGPDLKATGPGAGRREPRASVPRLSFITPDRSGLPSPSRYASLQLHGGVRRTVGYTEATRGCKHLCRHCPIVPVYGGQFRVVSRDVVLADIRAQVAAGAEHITFGDPDFFNGIRHATEIVQGVAREFPSLTYDVTIKVEHLLQHAAHLRTLRDTGCLFVTSAVESIDDHVLAILDKGHSRADFERAVSLCRDAGLLLSPTFVAFHPWLTLDGYCELLDTLEALDLVDQVAPIQLAIRLLVPEGSRLLELADVRAMVESFDAQTLVYPWRHADPRIDRLQAEIADLVGVKLTSSRSEVFDGVRALAFDRAGRAQPPRRAARDRSTVPYLNEPWYC